MKKAISTEIAFSFLQLLCGLAQTTPSNCKFSRFEQMGNGFLLTHDDTSTAFAIILHNVRTYRSGGVVAVVHGKRNAESTLKDFQEGQSPSDHHAGWRYFLEKSDLAAGTDPPKPPIAARPTSRGVKPKRQNDPVRPSNFGK